MSQQLFPPGWNEERVQSLIAHYDALNEEQSVAEDEASQDRADQTAVIVPIEMMPAIRQMLAQKNGI
jgi:hypothetical protein